MTPARAIVVDDESPARQRLVRMIREALPGRVEVVGEAADAEAALALLAAEEPDLAFVDVQMPGMDGLQLVAQMAHAQPYVIFTTAHDRYAIDAFEINAIDYLLKPVTEERFGEALRRAKARLAAHNAEQASRQILGLLEALAAPSRPLKRLAVRGAGKTLFVEVAEVDWVQAAENYVELHVGGKGHLLHVTLNALERALDPELFLRVHRSILVNVSRIRELRAAEHGEYVIMLQGDVRLRSGRSYHEALKALAANPF